MTIIGLLTDFGIRGTHYVAQMKGVAKNINPNVEFIDISHTVQPYSIIEAAYVLYSVYSRFPKGTIFVSVIDPGVGTLRKVICAKSRDGFLFVCPDNGLLSYFLLHDLIEYCIAVDDPDYYYEPFSDLVKREKEFKEREGRLNQTFKSSLKISKIDKKILNPNDTDEKEVEITSETDESILEENLNFGQANILESMLSESPSSKISIVSTFEGRDIMMPVSAHLSLGLDVFALGDLYSDPIVLKNLIPNVKKESFSDVVECLIQYIDDFGNCVTNLPSDHEIMALVDHTSRIALQIDSKDDSIPIRFSRVFSGNEGNQILFLPGSSQFMELVKNQSSAKESLSVKVGDFIKIIIH